MKQLKINNIKPVQEDFWGNGAIYHGYAGMPDSAGRVYTEEQCKLEAKRAGDMKLKIARTFYLWWAWDEKTNTWDWNNDIMTAFYKWLQRMKDNDITVALQACWNSPGDLESNTWTGKSPLTVEGDWEACLKNYGDFISETVHQLIELRDFTNIKILVMFTEPQGNKNAFVNLSSYESWEAAARAAHNALVRDNRRHLVKLMGPNEGSTVTSDMLKWVSERCNDFIDIYSSHSYQFVKSVPYKYYKQGKAVIFASIAGGTFFKDILLKPNTEYTAKIVLDFIKQDKAEGRGDIKFGVFKYQDSFSLYKDGKPICGMTDDSVLSIKTDDLNKENVITFKFTTSDETKGRFGMFYDIKNYAQTTITLMDLTESDGTSVIENSDFSDFFNTWTYFYCGATIDAYSDWYKWCKTGLQYVPKGKQFCYDEYNVTYNRDNSRPEHASEIAIPALAFMNAGVQSSLLWTVFDQQWPNNHVTNADSFIDGDHRCGVMPVLNRSIVPHISYYGFSLLSKYVTGEGTKVYEGFGEHKIATTMAVSKDGDITVVVVNGKEEDDEFNITFEKALEGVKFNRHTFDPAKCVPDEKAEIIGVDMVTEPVTTVLTDKIAAYGITVYTTIKD